MQIPHEVIELDTFAKPAAKFLSPEEIADMIVYLGFNPDAGDLIQGTGGVRKLRWARQGLGKSGGVRVIYFYYSLGKPLFLIDLYAKSDKDNLSKAERNDLYHLVDILIKTYRK